MKKLFCRPLLVLSLVVAIAACSPALMGQSAALGGVAGVVRDASGAVVPGASVVVTNTATGASRTVATDAAGHYEVQFLQPGPYEVLAGGGSFAKVDRKNIPVNVGATATVDVMLQAAGVTTDVVVTSDVPLIETERVAQSQVIDQHLVNDLPVNGRRFDNFVLLTPNVAPDGNTGLISYRGVSSLYNSNLVDGANNNQAFFSEARGRSIGAPYVYPVDAISEFSTENAGYSAEFGQAAGGIINAITKSGTNNWHGDVYEYYRTPGWNALDSFSKYNGRVTGNRLLLAQPIKTQHQFGASVGGPIIKDKLFFHFTYDGFRKVTPITYLSTYNTSTQNVNDLVALCDQRTSNYLARSGGAVIYPSVITGISAAQCTQAVAFFNTQLGSFGRNVKQDIFFPRLDYQLSERTHLSASYLWQNFHQPNGYNTSTTVNNGGVSQNGTANFHSRFLVVNAETALSDRSTNVAHFQFSRDLETDATNSGGPALLIGSLVAYGETNALPRGAFPDEHRIQATDIYSRLMGRHSVKAGVDLNFIHEQLQNLFQGDGSFSYNTGTVEYNFANWVQDVFQVNGGRHYNSFTQVNDPITHTGADDFWNQDLAFFGEDSWKVKPSLTLSLGLRYDLQLVPQPDKPNTSSSVAQLYTSTINIDKTMIQPRVGLSWNPLANTVVRAGFGTFYGLNSNSTYYTQRRENGVYQQQFNVSALTNPNTPYVACAQNGANTPNRCFQQSGSYASYAPQGGIPEFTPPGPAPINQVTGAATPAVNTNLPLGVLSARGLDPHFKNPESISYDLSVEQALPYHTTVSVGYVGNRALRLPIFVDTNVDPASATTRNYTYIASPTATPVNIALPYYTARLATTTGSVLTGFSEVNSKYNSFVATVRKPISNGIEVLANYTWAKAMDGGQVSGVNGTFNGTDTPIDPFARGRYQGRNAEYALSDMSVKGRFVGSITATSSVDRITDNALVRYALDGFQVSGALTAQTGVPVTGFMSNQPASPIGDGGLSGAELSLFNSGTPGRVPSQVAPRNAFRGPGIHNIDARITRTFPITERFRVQLFAEAFNIANHRNILSVNSSFMQYVGPGTNNVNTAAGVISCPSTATGGCIVPVSSTSPVFGSTASTSSILYGPRQLQVAAKFFF